MFQTILCAAALILIPQCAIAQVQLTPGVTLDGGPTRTLDLTGVGTNCGNLEVDLSAKTIRCEANSSVNRLTNVDNVNGPSAPVPFQVLGNDEANVLTDNNGMSALVGNGGADRLSCKAVSSCWGGAGADTFIYDGKDRIFKYRDKKTGKMVTGAVVDRVKDFNAAQGDKRVR